MSSLSLLKSALMLCLLLSPSVKLYAETFVVTNTGDSGPGTLRQALLNANNRSGHDTIVFAIGPGEKTISPLSALPFVDDAITIDATTQPGYNGRPIIELTGSLAGNTSALLIRSRNNLIRGLVINRWSTRAISIESGGSATTIQNCYIGTDLTGATAAQNGQQGILILNSPDNIIGGSQADQRNVISGSGREGILIVQQNSIHNIVQGNRIGTDVSGTVALPNGNGGVVINGAPDNIIGGTIDGTGNLVSGNRGTGIVLGGRDSANNVVQGNYVGTDISGTVALPNTTGVSASGLAHNNLIGGSELSARNIISGNQYSGIDNNSGIENISQNNFIGIGAGETILGNGGNGINSDYDATRNIYRDNYVAFNGGYGFFLAGNGGHYLLERNSVFANAGDGVMLWDNAPNSIIRDNYIFGNSRRGITVLGSGNRLEGNQVASNGSDGIFVSGVGGSPFLGMNNNLERNQVYDNGGYAIDLSDNAYGSDGVRSNDLYDSDQGANLQQNYPELTSAQFGGGKLFARGVLHSTPNTTFRIEVFVTQRAEAKRQGQFSYGSIYVQTDTNGTAAINIEITAFANIGSYVTATATDPSGNTSEFSNAVVVEAPNPVPTVTSLNPATVLRGSSQFTLSMSGTGFLASSKVKWNGAERTTQYVSATELRITVPASDLIQPAEVAISVSNPAPGGGISNSQTFTIANPVPTLTRLSPEGVTAGASSLIVTLTGTGFVPESQVKVDGVERRTLYISPTVLTVKLTKSDFDRPGALSLTVVNSAPGGGLSNAKLFTLTGVPQLALASALATRAANGTVSVTFTLKNIGTLQATRLKISAAKLAGVSTNNIPALPINLPDIAPNGVSVPISLTFPNAVLSGAQVLAVTILSGSTHSLTASRRITVP